MHCYAARVRLLSATLFLLCAACTNEPTPEYAKAKVAYQAAFADTADVTYKGARWDEVLALLKVVPTSNAPEHRLAQQLVSDIESTRARIAADLRASDDNANRLLEIKPLPPLEQPAQAPKPERTETQRLAEARQCVDACAASFESCMKAAGCNASGAKKKSEGRTLLSFDCPRNEAVKATACNNAVNACSDRCK